MAQFDVLLQLKIKKIFQRELISNQSKAWLLLDICTKHLTRHPDYARITSRLNPDHAQMLFKKRSNFNRFSMCRVATHFFPEILVHFFQNPSTSQYIFFIPLLMRNIRKPFLKKYHYFFSSQLCHAVDASTSGLPECAWYLRLSCRDLSSSGFGI